jgi:hypothetical protein
MGETNPTGFEDGLRRFLDDLRAEGDRRSGRERRRAERRVANIPVRRERRSGLDRRRDERRVHLDRRRPQVEQFTFTESRMIREMVQDPTRPGACPLCEGTLLLGPVETHAGVRMQDVVCTNCRRSTLLVDG